MVLNIWHCRKSVYFDYTARINEKENILYDDDDDNDQCNQLYSVAGMKKISKKYAVDQENDNLTKEQRRIEYYVGCLISKCKSVFWCYLRNRLIILIFLPL